MKLKEGLMIGLLLLGCPLLLISSRWASRLECKQAINPKAPNQIVVRPTAYKSDVYGLWVLLGLAQGAGAFWMIKEARKDEGDGEGDRALSLPQAPTPIGHLQQATAPQWQEPQRVVAELLPIETTAQVQPMAQPATAQPQVPAEYRWFKDLINYPVVLIHGAQGAGKTSFAAYLMRQKIKAGHYGEVYDPHAAYGQWKGLRVVGGGMDYEALDTELGNYAAAVQADYEKRNTTPNYKPDHLSTVLVEEFTNWGMHCKRSGRFFQASLSDIRKIGRCVVYISHGRTLTTLGNAKGLAATRDSSLLELELLAKVDPVSGEAVPAMKGYLKYPGKESVEVAIATWMNGAMNFTDVVPPVVKHVDGSPRTATKEQIDIRAQLENLVSLPADFVPPSENEENDQRTESRTEGTTNGESFSAPLMDVEKFRSSFPGTTETELFERIKKENENGLSPSDIVKQCLGVSKEKYMLGKAACIYLIRKYGGIELMINFEKWLGA